MAELGTADSPLFGSKLNSRRNGLNLIRLLLALAVLLHHSWPLSGLGGGPSFAGETLGGWAVAGFFGISGYLITASRFSHGLGDYLVHRVARIMPAFLVCLLLMVSVFGPIGWYHSHHTFSGYLTTPTTPLSFLFNNFFLKINQYDIAGGPAGVPYAGAWNGSLWSLYYEFLCYLIIAALGLFAVVRKYPWILTLAFGASVALQANMTYLSKFIPNNGDFDLLVRLLPYFLGGSVVFVWRHKVGIHWIPGAFSILAACAIAWLIPDWGGQLAGVFIAYGLLWVASWLPSPQLIRRNDISYGVYIYAFAVQQLLALFGAYEAGPWVFSLAAGLLTIPLAMCSWLLVERPVMRRVRRRDSPPIVGPRLAPVSEVNAVQVGEESATPALAGR